MASIFKPSQLGSHSTSRDVRSPVEQVASSSIREYPVPLSIAYLALSECEGLLVRCSVETWFAVKIELMITNVTSDVIFFV